MKRFFTFAVALVALLFAACEPEGATPLDSKLTRTSGALMEFNAAGGAGEITYTIENPTNGVQVIARCEASWIDGLTSSDNKVTFTVKPNTTGQSRITIITVTYGSNCQFEVAVSQSATGGNTGSGNNNGNYDKEIELQMFYCSYAGTYYGTPANNYYVIVSDCEMDSEGYLPENALLYYFDLYSNVAATSSTIVLPNGTYNFDTEDTGTANTIGYLYSYYSETEEDAYYFEDATVIVSNNKFEATVKVNGKTHHLVYEGALFCNDDSEGEGDDDYDDGSGDDDGNDDGGSNDDDYYYAYSNLTEDYSFNIAGGNAYGYIDFYGDYYEVGVNNFYLDLYEDIENGQGLNIFIDLLASTSATNFVGTYTPYYTSDSDSYTFIEGYTNEEGYLLGSWIATLANGEISEGPLAPISLGSVTIAATNTDNVYTVTLNCEDDLGYKISGTYKGELEYGDYSDYAEEYAAPKKASKKGVNITKKAIKKVSKKIRFARR